MRLRGKFSKYFNPRKQALFKETTPAILTKIKNYCLLRKSMVTPRHLLVGRNFLYRILGA